MSSVLDATSSTHAKIGASVELVVTGNELRRMRADRGLSQAAVATALGVSRQTINSIETGRYIPSLGLAIGLARYFSSTVEEVFHAQPR